MNPIENEAVVAEILRTSGGSLELVDKRSDMPSLKVRPGWTTWKVMATRMGDNTEIKTKSTRRGDKREKEKEAGVGVNGTTTASVDDADRPLSWDEHSLRQRALDLGYTIFDSFDDVAEDSRSRIRRSCFPPTREEIDEFRLERCMRCLPQDMNTGGFFVALFHKVEPVGSRRKERDDETGTRRRSDVRSRRDAASARGDLGHADFVDPPKETLSELIEFYGLSDDFPRDRIMTRSSDNAKFLHFVSRSVKETLVDRLAVQEWATVVTLGLRVFERSTIDNAVSHRLSQEGVHMMMPYLTTKRTFGVDPADFTSCLDCASAGSGVPVDELSDALANRVRSLSVGSFVVALEGYENDVAKKMMLVMLRCRSDATVMCLVSKKETDGMRTKLEAITKS